MFLDGFVLFIFNGDRRFVVRSVKANIIMAINNCFRVCFLTDSSGEVEGVFKGVFVDFTELINRILWQDNISGRKKMTNINQPKLL